MTPESAIDILWAMVCVSMALMPHRERGWPIDSDADWREAG
jgi:hypothetical protein